MDEKQEERAQRTADEIRDALDNYVLLPNSTFQTFAQGSKRNNTDVPGDSDVDIGVVALEDITNRAFASEASFSMERAPVVREATNSALGLAPTTDRHFRTTEFKENVYLALVDHFGASNVKRANKCITVRSSALTLPADVVPCLPYRLYHGRDAYQEGIRIFPDRGPAVVNFPEQHYRNGSTKNNSTGRRFKRIVRCLKRMENDLLSRGTIKEATPSFLMECLLYRVDNDYFNPESYVESFINTVGFAWYRTCAPERCIGWQEINDIKPLFQNEGGAFDRAQASDLLWHAFQTVEAS